jgi:hypothetical protein
MASAILSLFFSFFEELLPSAAHTKSMQKVSAARKRCFLKQNDEINR